MNYIPLGRLEPEVMSRWVFKDRPIRWFIFGTNPTTGKVTIADVDGDVINDVDPKVADEIVDAHNKVVGYLEDCFYLYRQEVERK